ncbi:hypothetical protein L6R49_13045 [Myxococcota bacterium]|nr:hypothetical protein [Myxococcota bacterium]
MAIEQTQKELTLDKAGAREEREKAERDRAISEEHMKSRVSEDDGAARSEEREKAREHVTGSGREEQKVKVIAEEQQKATAEEKGKGDRGAGHTEQYQKADVSTEAETTARPPKVI